MGRNGASARSRPDTPGDDADTRLAAITARAEQILADPAGLCEKAAFELVNLSEQIACLRVALEDDAADAFAISVAHAAGVIEGERRAAARQRPAAPRSSLQDPQPILRLLPPVPSEKPRRVPAAVIVAAAGKLAAGTASTAAAIPLPD